MAEENLEKLQELIDGSDNIVFFGGAGVSTESGIKDFRSVDGLYHQKFKYPPETMLSHTFYVSHKEEFFEFYRDKLLECTCGQHPAKPNAAHRALAELEKKGKLKAVITQNIDGLHQAAGSEHVLELHGSVLRNYCENCGKSFTAKYVYEKNGIPWCDACGGDIKPDVVLYEEGLDNGIMDAAVRAISEADMLIIGGTSLVVYPAAGLIRYYRGKKLVLINRDATAMDEVANYIFRGNIGEIFSGIKI
ncbi:MAG: NAD-dependent protein deacylase [Lachnospiraceae bacterium]|nr:NAD-dependent protein deacylase [Lachnospiraceae bacterium]